MKLFIFFCFIILESSALDIPSFVWFCSGKKCFLKDDSKVYSFEENLDFCESLNATAVSIPSKEDNDFINSKLSRGRIYWLGIRQVDFDFGTYAWLDGSVYSYSNWKERMGKKLCAGANIWGGKWFDWKNCDRRSYAFCQIDLKSPFYKIQLQIRYLSYDFEENRNEQDRRLNETIVKLDKALNTTSGLIRNLNSTFEAKLNDEHIQVKQTLADVKHFISLLNHSTVKNLLADKVLEESTNKNMTLVWIFGISSLFIFSTLIFLMFLIVQRFRWLTKEVKLSNGVMCEREPITENID